MRYKILLLICSVSIASATSLLAQSIKPAMIGIVVRDIEKAAQWYENTLQVKQYKKMSFPEYDSLKIYFLKGEYFQLELMEKKSAFSISEYVPNYSINHKPLIGFSKIAFTVSDINAMYNRLKKLNVNIIMDITEDKEFQTSYFIIKDLDGNAIQFIEHKKE